MLSRLPHRERGLDLWSRGEITLCLDWGRLCVASFSRLLFSTRLRLHTTGLNERRTRPVVSSRSSIRSGWKRWTVLGIVGVLLLLLVGTAVKPLLLLQTSSTLSSSSPSLVSQRSTWSSDVIVLGLCLIGRGLITAFALSLMSLALLEARDLGDSRFVPLIRWIWLVTPLAAAWKSILLWGTAWTLLELECK